MKVLKLNTPFEISAVVRTAPAQSDTLVLTVLNEFNQISFNYTLTWVVNNDRIEFTLPNTNPDLKAGNKYEIYINNTTTEDIIYRGKMIVVNENTDIQNYTPSKQVTQRFK